MDTQLVVAIIAAAVSLATAVGTIATSWISSGRSHANAQAIEKLKIDYDKLKVAAQREKEISKFSEPLARAAYDLQSRFYNILRLEFIAMFLAKGDDREKAYGVNNTAFLIGQYMCWNEMVRREIQYIDLGSNDKTRQLLALQDRIYNIWGTDRQPKVLRIFAGEQRAIGEALIENSPRGPECIGYGAFLAKFTKGTNTLVDNLRDDLASLDTSLHQARERLANLQHAFIDLLAMLDPDYIRFPKSNRTKA